MRSSSSSSAGKSSSPTRRSPPFTRARGAAITTLALLLSGGCGAIEQAGEPEPAATTDLAAGAAGERNRPVPPPEYSASELEALAGSPEVKNLNEPFAAAAPAPDRSLHVTMSDGTRRAVNLYFPTGFDATTGRAPVVYIEAWYGHAIEATGTAIDLYRAAGFIVAITDLRGVGASFGSLPAFMTEEVRRDQRELIAWFASQPWSTGQVAAEGFSISATYAEAMAASGAPALLAAVIRASDFDQFANVFPGGIPNPRMMGLVTEVTTWMRGEPCLADLSICGAIGIPPVDGDTDFRLLQAAFGDHRTNLRGEALDSVVYKDDPLGTGSVEEMSPAGSVEQLRLAAVPARLSASWLDGSTAEGALARFKALPDVRMEVFISATAHSGGVDADPFSRKPFQAARPGFAEQYAADVAFVRRALAGEPIGRSVSYYVLGAGVWKTTAEWPPAGVSDRVFQLSRTQLVTGTGTDVRAGQRAYAVDPTTSSGGPFNRWGSQGGMPVYYGDRRAAPGRRLAFESSPAQRDTELVGAPELCLALRTDQPDGTVFAYLEDVAPDGRITYLTEGELRLLHRRTVGAATGMSGTNQPSACDPAPGTARSFKRADGAAVTPGELMHVELPLLPTAALIQKGHRLRLSLAGADAGTFAPLSDAPTTWLVSYGGDDGTTLRVPVRTWSR